MHFHHHGYVSHDPMIQEAARTGIDRPAELPETMDVLIVGTGPAGMIAAAQLAQFPQLSTRIIERRPGRLEIGQADGIQARSVETFQAFGFAGRITDEAYQITEMAFWKPSQENPEHIVPTGRPVDDPHGVSEFPHLIVNQARVLDYFAEFAKRAPGRITPDYGWEFLGYEIADDTADYPVAARLRRTVDASGAPLPEGTEGEERTVRAKYVVGCDGARSSVRRAMGHRLEGDAANHAWGVMDVLANTDFPDIRLKCAIQSKFGQILLIPREGGHLFRMYVDLGEVPAENNGAVRNTPLSEIIERANRILTPYSLDVKHVAWHSVYEVGHRLTNAFDDLPEDGCRQHPRVFITGDACHTHSAKAGQGMNVSMQDGWNIAWKLGHVLTGVSGPELLSTYSAERQVVAKNLIDFDKEWSTLMATPPEQLPDPSYLEDFYVKTAEFPAGFMTEYTPSKITAGTEHQHLAPGFPVGKRFRSAKTTRVCDGVPVHLGHTATADGRYRIYVFAAEQDAARPGDGSALASWAAWMQGGAASPLARFGSGSGTGSEQGSGTGSPLGPDANSLIDSRVVYPVKHTEIALMQAPEMFRPQVGPFALDYLENVYGLNAEEDIFALRGIDPARGAVVIVRPDQYVGAVLPLEKPELVGEYFSSVFA